MACRKLIGLMTMILCFAFSGVAQNYSDDVQYISGDENVVTVSASATAEKKKDAEILAIKSAFNSLFYTGIDGIKNGNAMLSSKKSDYDYRFFSENRYINYLVGEPKTTNVDKIAKNRRATVTLTINIRTLKGELTRNGQLLSPVWSDAKKEKATAALNPTIVIVPYTDETHGYSFLSMRRIVEGDKGYRHAIAKAAELFNQHGYKTRDFAAQLMGMQTDDLLHEDAQNDNASMVARELPGDIVVTIDYSTKTQNNNMGVDITMRAREQQTYGDLGSVSFSSGYHYTSDPVSVINRAFQDSQESFFTQLATNFEKMVADGREVVLQFNLSQTISDWDFDLDSPATGDNFKEELQSWADAKSQSGVANMDRQTDKYIELRLNVPLWSTDRNRSYKLSNFASDLRKFLKEQLGSDYKAKVSLLGQKIDVTIE